MESELVCDSSCKQLFPPYYRVLTLEIPSKHKHISLYRKLHLISDALLL